MKEESIDPNDAVSEFNIGNISSPIISITSGIAGIKLMIPNSNISATNCVSSPDVPSPPFLPSVQPSARVLAIKRGFRSIRTPRTCGVSFEALPVWLWTLRPKEWSQIFITGPDEARLHQAHPELRDILVDKLTIVLAPPIRDSRCSLADVWWVSGREPYLQGLALPSVVVQVIWASAVGRRLPASLACTNTNWTSINHSRIGGVTNARGWFGVKGLDPLIIPSDLSRTLSHVLKHSIRGIPCSPTTGATHYTPHDRLSVKDVARPILYPSHFSRSGWSMRALEGEELSMCFELPPFVGWDPGFPDTIVPLQLFRSVIDSVLDQLDPKTGSCEGTRRQRVALQAGDVEVSRDGEWLPLLQKWLPGSWTDVAISDRAVKADDAVVDCRPWHMRISLVLPCSPTTLAILTRFTMRRWRFNVFRSFLQYLTMRYGSNWQTLLALTPPLRTSDGGGNRGTKRTSGGAAAPGSLPRQRAAEMGGNEGWRLWESDQAKIQDLVVDLKRGLRVLGQVLCSTWWEWNSGSSLIFWRWNGAEQIKASRDGMEIFVQSPLPRRNHKAKNLKFSDEIRTLVAHKVHGMIQKGYLEFGRVRTSLHYFAVPKGDTDIRVVYDGTSCGLNDSLWSPNFFLPTAKSAGLLLSFGTWMADMDFGEFFHNFPMTERIRQHSGVNTNALLMPVVNVICNNTNDYRTLRWSRLFMGMKPSPYNAVRHYYWGEEFARGNPTTLGNPFGYDKVILNLPGMELYDPTLPKVMRWNSAQACMAGDVIAFIDDVRMTGSSKERCHEVHRQFTSRMQYLGFQDAPRKFRPPSQTSAGAWTGTIFSVGKTVITKTVSQDKWSKGRSLVTDLSNQCKEEEGNRPVMNRKDLERSTGFLNHLSTTFDEMTPYLKGFYLTLNSWRSKRDNQDWKVSDKVWLQLLTAQLEKGLISSVEFDTAFDNNADVSCGPINVTASPRFSSDVGALVEMFKMKSPPVVGLRSKLIVTVVYGFGDASGTGLGATFTCGKGFSFRIGVWGACEADESSNWKEFSNIVDSLEDEARLGNLQDSEVFMFTDNSTVESCSVKGSSTSPKLLELVIRLKCLTTEFGIKLNIFHVSGTRMIAQGTDGVSRGFLGAGVMSGESMTSFIPIHESATDRSTLLVAWVESWVGVPGLTQLSPKHWFDAGHDIMGWSRGWDGFERPIISEGRTYLWAPPPFAADVAISELRKARIKRQRSAHIFICPRLCTALWARQLFKAADIVLEIPAGKSFWTSEMHEPLLIGIVFPFIRCKPWQLRSTPKMFSVAREVRSLCDGSEMDLRDFLFKFWGKCHRLRNMSADVVRRLLFIDNGIEVPRG